MSRKGPLREIVGVRTGETPAGFEREYELLECGHEKRVFNLRRRPHPKTNQRRCGVCWVESIEGSREASCE